MPTAILVIWIVSRLDRSGRAAIDKRGYAAQRVRAETGIGADRANQH
jgi:cation/acetate symporter